MRTHEFKSDAYQAYIEQVVREFEHDDLRQRFDYFDDVAELVERRGVLHGQRVA